MIQRKNKILKLMKISKALLLASYRRFLFALSFFRCPLSIVRRPLSIIRSPLSVLLSLMVITLTLSLTLSPTLSFAQTKEIEMSTYHISPVNTYKYIQLVPKEKAAIGDFGDACAIEGQVQVATDGSIFLCHSNQLKPLSGIWRQDNNDIFLTDENNPKEKFVGIGTILPEFKLTLDLDDSNPDGGILAKGIEILPSVIDDDYSDFSSLSNLLDESSEYAMLLWYPQKGAFRALQTPDSSSDFWDEANIGYYSTALGKNNQARSMASFAAGSNNIVNGPLSAIVGGDNNFINTNVTDQNAKELILGSTIIGGELNQITGPDDGTDIGGPGGNLIAGGRRNNILAASMSAIIGGCDNLIDNSANNFTESNTNYNNPSRRLFSLILSGGSYWSTGEWNGWTHHQITSYNDAIAEGSVIVGAGSGLEARIRGASFSGITAPSYCYIGNYDSDSASYLPMTHAFLGAAYDSSIKGDYSAALALGWTYHFSGHHSIILAQDDLGPISANYASIAATAEEIQAWSTGLEISGEYFSLGAGINPYITGNYGFIGSIYGNTSEAAGDIIDLSGSYSVMPVSLKNQLSGSYSFASGKEIVCSSAHSTCYSNVNDSSNGEYSWFFGNIANTGGTRRFVWNGDSGTLNLPGANGNDIAVLNTDAFGINTKTPQHTLDVNGTIRTEKLFIDTLKTAAGSSLKVLEPGGQLTLDLAEEINATEAVEPGDVLVINKTSPEKVSKSNGPYDKNVVGVVSSAPALLFSTSGVTANPGTTPESTQTPPVALAGRVPVKVSTENGPIKPGDLLTSSSAPGVAMKATDRTLATHAVIGKALEKFDQKENGKILAIVTLR